VRDPVNPSPQPDDYSLVVDDLRFTYSPSEAAALDGVSFRLPQGGRLTVVGASGSGKTTLVNLLLRFWDYREGHIRLGGNELRDYRAEDVRRLVAVVSQNTHLFNGTLRDNLLMALPADRSKHGQAKEDDLWHALRQVQLEAFVRCLPDGLDTWIGEQGLRLSGGERQRVSIARALLRDAPILILDEVTANLDTLTEREVLQALDTLMDGRTSLIITHRLVGLRATDEVLVLQSGRVLERGRHDELLQADTVYRRMWALQYQVPGGKPLSQNL
jgi:ATP-binding cassette subfamily C protein CydC